MKLSNLPFGKITIILLSLIVVSCNSANHIEKSKVAFAAPPSADALANPLKGDSLSTLAGMRLYTKECTPCHGKKGEGDGIGSVSLRKMPANHTAMKMNDLTDGALYWKITNGFDPMPSYKRLNDTQRWQLVNYLRTLPRAAK